MIARILCGFFAAALLAAAPLHAEEVRTRYRGLTVNGNLELAPGKGLEDGVILLAHDQLAHNRAEPMLALQRGLKARGLSTVAINLSLGVNDRRGMFDCARPHTHRPTDALDEIEAWIGWLKAQGAIEIALLGHGEGGAQVALYAAERRDPAVGAVILLAPATFDPAQVAAAYEQRHGAPLAPVLVQAEDLLRGGRGVTPVERIGFLTCSNATATASSIVGWYAPSPQRNTPVLLPRIRQRTLVVAAGADTVVPDLTAQLGRIEAQRNLTVEMIDGADHLFLGRYAGDAVEIVVDWLER